MIILINLIECLWGTPEDTLISQSKNILYINDVTNVHHNKRFLLRFIKFITFYYNLESSLNFRKLIFFIKIFLPLNFLFFSFHFVDKAISLPFDSTAVILLFFFYNFTMLV